MSICLLNSCSNSTDDSFSIEMSGGYWIGGINPSNTSTTIYENGNITSTTTYLYTDTQIYNKVTSSENVKELYNYMVDNNFENITDYFDCAIGDTICEEIKYDYPPANPLTIKLNESDITHSVTITVFGLTETPVIEYPSVIDSIVVKIRNLYANAS